MSKKLLTMLIINASPAWVTWTRCAFQHHGIEFKKIDTARTVKAGVQAIAENTNIPYDMILIKVGNEKK